MSRVLPAFDPSAVPSGTFDTTLGPSGTGTLIGHNLSPYELILDFGNGNRKLLPAWSGRRYDVCVPTPSVSYAVDATPNQSGPPLSLVYFEAYPDGEQINEQYPVAYTRQTSIGNQVSTTSSNTLINDGAAAGTQIIEMTPQGYAQSFYVLKNDGTLTLYAVSNGTVTQLLSVTPGTASTPANVVIGSLSNGATTAVHGEADSAASVAASGISGTLPASQVGSGYPAANLAAGTLPSGVTVPAGNVNGTVADAGALIAPQNGNGVAVYYDSAAGQYGIYPAELPSTPAGLAGYGWSGTAANYAWKTGGDGGFYVVQYLQLPYGGKIHAISMFSGTGAGTFSHGLGTTPSWVGITTTEANSTETVGVDSINSSSVHVNQGTSGWPWIGVAIA